MAFAESFEAYLRAGWIPLPLPYGKKYPPPEGYTGMGARTPTGPDLWAWAEGPAPRNIASRMPPGVIGIDIDTHDGKPGAATLEALEAECGPLPLTARSSAQGFEDGHGIRFYRVPDGYNVGGMRDPGPGIEIIRPTHRYAVLPPSKHPGGQIYEWEQYNLPQVRDLAELPVSWVPRLYHSPSMPTSTESDGFDPFDQHEWTIEQALEQRDAMLRELAGLEHGRNNRLNDVAMWLGHFGEEFWPAEETGRLLLTAMKANGYAAEEGPGPVKATIRSGFKAGQASWRAVLRPESAAAGLKEAGGGEDTGRPFLVDLGPYLDGSIVRSEPERGVLLPGGHRMLYAGKAHALIGETESGKSWLALMCCLAEMEMGRHVGYVHFEEGDPAGTVERLLLLGAETAVVRELFHFAGPESKVGQEQVAELTEHEPSVVILDGVNDAMALHGYGINDPDGVSHHRRRLVRPFTRIGASVLELDHVTKNADTRGRDAFGSVHKGNNLDGARFTLETAQPFGRGRSGESRLYVTKDRPGYLRERGEADKRMPGKTHLGQLCVVATMVEESGRVKTAIREPDVFDAPDRDRALEDRIVDAVLAYATRGEESSMTKVIDKVGGRRTDVRHAVERLKDQGRIAEGTGQRGARVLTPPREDQEQPGPEDDHDPARP